MLTGLRQVVAATVTVGFAWWATSLRPFTWPALAATLGGGAAAIAVGIRLRARPNTGADGTGTGMWLVLVVALVGWELASYLQHPRADHPTLSSIANEVLGIRPVRALAMVVWLIVGVRLAQR